MLSALVGLQLFHVLFLALHDWVPLGRLNDVKAAQEANPGGQLLRTTLVSTVPYLFGLLATFYYSGQRFPGWLRSWLWGSYLILLLGELTAWWIPYCFGTSAARVERYRRMFGRTASFLPARHGILPNTLHVVLHGATVAMLAMLAGVNR